MDPLETASLLAFTRAVEAASLSKAALELGVPRATLSRRIDTLEARLGVRLLRRSTRRLALTDAGEELYRRARGVLAAVEDAERAVQRAEGAVRGLLRVTTPPFPDPTVASVFAAFQQRYPAVRLEVFTTTQHVDLLASGFDVALRAGAELPPGVIARVLERAALIAVASPGYLARAGAPASAEALAQHTCVVGYARGEQPATHWPLVGGGQVRVHAALASNDLLILRAAALEGGGIALLPERWVARELERGALVQVLAGEVGGESKIALIYPERELLPPAVKAFVAFMTEAWERAPWGRAWERIP